CFGKSTGDGSSSWWRQSHALFHSIHVRVSYVNMIQDCQNRIIANIEYRTTASDEKTEKWGMMFCNCDSQKPFRNSFIFKKSFTIAEFEVLIIT
ncbi:Hypothetical predicted protein, partial [Paramuricea clavata]